MPRIVIHIGFERTGTTSLQSCLASNRAVLARYSILYPKRSPAFNGLNHTPLVAAYMPENREDPFLKVPAGRRAAIIASLKREIDGSAQDTIILSAEHFSSRFRYDQIEALRADFAAYECRILLVLRDHISSFASAYSSHVTAGGRLTIEAFADEVLLPGNVYLRYSEMIGPWQKIFGHDQVNCLAYRKGTIDDVFAKIGVPASTALVSVRKEVESDESFVIQERRSNLEAADVDDAEPGWIRSQRLTLPQ